jgi:hypothetical protein
MMLVAPIEVSKTNMSKDICSNSGWSCISTQTPNDVFSSESGSMSEFYERR